MKTVIVYESMYGNTRLVAERIGEVAQRVGEVDVVPVTSATPRVADGADLVIVGGPTHIHGMSRASTRRGAATAAAKEEGPAMEPGAEGAGLREWFDSLESAAETPAAAFDTRLSGPPMVTGRASHGIARRLRHHGFVEVCEPGSFLVDKRDHLLTGELDRAAAWAESVLGHCPATAQMSVVDAPGPGPGPGPGRA
jgi:hypothetical protein